MAKRSASVKRSASRKGGKRSASVKRSASKRGGARRTRRSASRQASKA